MLAIASLHRPPTLHFALPPALQAKNEIVRGAGAVGR